MESNDADQNERREIDAGACGKAFATVFSVVLILLVLSPIVENLKARPADSFPLSPYPMFAKKRNETQTVTYFVGYTEQGERLIVHSRYGATGGMNQARKQIVKRAKENPDKFCRRVAGRIMRDASKELGEIVKLSIVTGEYNLNDYFKGSRTPLREEVKATCDVERNAEKKDVEANDDERKDSKKEVTDEPVEQDS